MTTALTSTVVYWKKAIYWIGLAVAGIIVVFIVFKLVSFLISRVSPPPPAPAIVAFGRLPQLDLSEGIKAQQGTRYEIETITGDLPNLNAYVKVFAISQPSSTFGLLEKAVARAQKAGFNPVPIETSGINAIFLDKKDSSRILTIELLSGSISLESNYLRNPLIITSRPTSTEKSKSAVTKFFNQLGLSTKIFPPDKITTENYKIENGLLEKAISLSSATLVKVAFNRADLDELPFINSELNNPLIWGLATNNNVVSAEYILNNTQKYKFSTYPLKGTETAYEHLSNGQGMLNMTPTSNIFPIRKVILGYLETRKYQPYLQPVYIFVSDEGLAAYVSAVSDEWVKTASD